MGSKSQSHFGMLEVRYIVFPASLFDDFADSRIMYVGNIWKKVMLNLEIQSPNQPRNDFIVSCKVCSGP